MMNPISGIHESWIHKIWVDKFDTKDFYIRKIDNTSWDELLREDCLIIKKDQQYTTATIVKGWYEYNDTSTRLRYSLRNWIKKIS